MRNSSQSSNQILRTEDGTIIGISLAADYCAEHEWGIKAFKRKMGLTSDPQSFADLCIDHQPALQARDTAETGLMLTSTSHNIDGNGYIENLAPEWKMFRQPRKGEVIEPVHFTAAWDEADFLVRGWTPEGREAVQLIIDGFKDGDIAVWLGGGGVFQNAGFVICRPSRVPQTLKDTMDAGYADRRAIKAAADATGVFDRIERRAYYALSPKWISDSLKERSAHPVMFWLNPCEQHLYQSNWVTVEDLDDWLQGKGRIIKQPKTA